MTLQRVALQCTKTTLSETLAQYECPVDDGDDSGGALAERYTFDRGNSILISSHGNHGPKQC